MNRSFILPTAIACSAHALLMFGFTPPEPRPAARPVAAHPKSLPPHVPITIEEIPDIIEVKVSDIPPLKKTVVAPSDPSTTRPVGETDSNLKPPSPERGPDKIDVFSGDGPRLTYHPGNPYTGDSGNEKGFVYPAATLDSAPRARFQAPPAYPYALKSSGVSGEVLVEFVVDESGHVVNPRVLRSSHFEFEAPTLAAVSRWRFEPGTRNTRAVKFMMRLPVTFSVEN